MPRRCMQQKPSPLPFPMLSTPPSSPRIPTPVSLSSSTSTVAGPHPLPDSPLSTTPPLSPSATSLLSGIPLLETRHIRTEIAPQISLTPPLPPRNPLVSPPTPPRPSLKKKRKAPPASTPTQAPTPTPLLLPLLPLMTPPSTSTATQSCYTSTTTSSTASSGVASAAATASAPGLPSATTQLPIHIIPPPQTSTSSFSTSSFSTTSTSCPESGSTSGSTYAVSQHHHSTVSAVIATVINNNNNSHNNNIHNNNSHNNNGNSSSNNSNTTSSNNATGFASCTSTPPLTRQPPTSSSSATAPTAGISLSVSASKVLPAAAAAVGFPQMLGQENTKDKLISSSTNSTTGAMGSKLFQRRSAVTRSTMNTNRRYSSRDTTDEREKVARSIFGDVPLSDVERRYLAAAVEGNMSQILRCIQAGVNVNCRDYLGRTALHLSLQGDHYEETKFLMDHCNLDVIEEGLLHAIKLENVRMCDMILNHPVYSDERNRIRLEFQHGFYDQDENNSNFSPDITPIVLAAQCNNFDIVHMLLRKGFCIDTPHHYFCLCTECNNHKKFDRFVHSRSRLNAYRGLASTAYMALSSDDPVLTAFELSEQLKGLEEKEKEHKSEYKALCDHCKNYAVELLELCRTNEEVMAALHGGADVHDLSRVRMAIKYEQKRFIAHASCQEHLMSIWYADVPWFQHQSFIVKLFIVPLGILFIPVTAIIYVFLPYSKLGEILRSPFMKFMNYMCSYMAFLVFLLIATTSKNTTSNSEPWVVRGFIIFYVFGMFWAECKQLWDEGVKEYFAQMWNYMDITMLALYTASYTIESIVSIKANSYDDTSNSEFSDNLLPNPRVLALVLFSVANVLSFARIAYILPASETFGQLQISYGRMLQDVFKFICIYFTVMIAFICGLTSLYSYSGESNFNELLTTFETLFWAAFGMGNPKAPKQTEKGNHLVETVGNLMYGVYIIGAVVVLINMLIAMMSNTFEEIQDDEDVEWKFARAKLWISFIDGSGTLPIPFNIIPTPKSIFKLFVYLKKMFIRYLLHPGERPTSPRTIIDYEYKTILHKVVLRYIHKMKYDKKGDVVRDEIFDAKEEIISNVINAYNRLSSRMDAIESNLMGLEAKIVSGNICVTNQPADYCSTDTIAQDNRSLHGNQSLNPSPTLKERRPHQESHRNLLSTSRQSFTTEAQCHSTEGQDWGDRSSRFGSSKSEGRPFRPRKQMDSVTECEMSRSVPLHSKYFSHEV